ncbi:MAG: Polyhydroxyalkanoic acid synthase [uncultured Rubrobacteraceae bacterium]|uniref:Polyhydroxyalkanoic acid synthase n=1 Tax=uncultured Rubrobacteraceae bacterium TaxID=349277 RepID=A0A6J4QFV3_9ACTN|nr:MAG: Polyhydroxyalkanoic acid synthase [uncultured Rubrobacteraceae bacterium]
MVLVYALILRPYIMDPVPGNSFVEYLFDEGFDVYLLDWGVPDARTATSRSRTTSWATCRRRWSGSSKPPGPEG